ncbi:MAG: hypothetical protein HZA93_29405 [Verrucomicrobia bacterium]|nr:hypothetical protein [Verrucomicrobiota bacterium]
MSFLTPKVETGVNTGDNTPGRTATQSPRQTLPLVLGRGRVVVQWVTPVLEWFPRTTSRSQYWFFSCYGWLCCGPIDEIEQLIVNDKPYFALSKQREDYPGTDYVDDVLSKETPEKFRLYWGREDGGSRTAHLHSLIVPQYAPGLIEPDGITIKPFPYDLGIAALAVQHMEAGQSADGRTPPLPKVEAIVYRRSPAAYSFGYSAKGTHPVGLVKDLLTLKRGGRGLPAAMFDDADWTAKMQRLMDDGVATMKGHDLYLSLVAAEAKEVDQYVADVLAYLGGWLVERNGQLYLDWQPNDGTSLDETGLRVITEHHLAGEVDEDPGHLDGVPSQVIVTGLDWTANPPLTEVSESAPVPFVSRLVKGRREPEQLNRPGFTERAQLKSYATMLAALRPSPEASFTVPLLRQYAVQPDNLTPLRPGDRFVLNLAGNGGKRVVVRVTERSGEDAVRVTLKGQRERGTYPQPAQPVLDPRIDPTIDPPADLARYAVAQLPPDLSDPADTLVAALVERPSSSVHAHQVHLSPTNSWPGQVIAPRNVNFAVAAVLQTNLGVSYADATVNVDTVGHEWSYLRSQSALEQGDDQLLCWHGGEWCSIGAITPLGGGSYSMTIKRARLGSLPLAHAIGAVLFLIPRNDLVALTHAEFANVEAAGSYDAATATKWFKLRPLGAGGLEGNLTAAFSLPLRDPTPDAVTDLQARTGTGKLVELRWTKIATALVNEYHIYRGTGPAYADEAKVAEAGGEESRWIDIGVAFGVTYRYRLKAITTDEHDSAFSNDVLATPGVVSGLDVDYTPPANPGNITLDSSGTYLGDDGTVFSYVILNLPPLPAGAIGQTVKRRRAGEAGAWEDVGQTFNAAATTIRQDDLTPGTSYDFALEAFSWSGVPSAIVVPPTSPYLAPKKSTNPTAPGAITYTAGNSTSFNRPPVFSRDANGNVQMLMSVLMTWPTSTDKDIAGYEWVATSDSNTAADNVAAAGLATFTVMPEAIYSFPTPAPLYFRVRCVDSSRRRSAWSGGGTVLSGLMALPAGSMSQQQASAVAISGGTATGLTQLATTGLTIGAGTSQRKVIARQPIYATIDLVGGLAQETIDFSLAGFGFSTRPDSGWMQSADWDGLLIRYDLDDSTSTVAKLRVTMANGGNTPAVTGLEVTGEFLEYD